MSFLSCPSDPGFLSKLLPDSLSFLTLKSGIAKNEEFGAGNKPADFVGRDL